MGRRVLICGSRDFADRAMMFRELDFAHTSTPISVIIHGAQGCDLPGRPSRKQIGADRFADEWAVTHGVEPLRFHANWDEQGLSAGPIRNQLMLDKGKPDVVFAFSGGRGTADMLRRALKAGIPIVRF
jgi:hypothetical protein